MTADGILPLDDPTASFHGSSSGEIRAILARNFVPAKNAVLEQ